MSYGRFFDSGIATIAGSTDARFINPFAENLFGVEDISFKRFIFMVVLVALLSATVEAQSTWQLSQNENSSINFSYSGFDDALLDYTTPVQFRAIYQSSSNEPIDNATGSCFLNFTSPLTHSVELNYAENGLYYVNLTAPEKSLDNVFQIYCIDDGNHSHDHLFSNEGTPVTFQYDLYEPIIVDVYSSNETGPSAGTVPAVLAGQPTTLYLLIRNITGNTTPANITDAACNISLNGNNRTADAGGFGDYYSGRFIPGLSGNLSMSGACLYDGTIYHALSRNLSVSPLLVPSGYDLGEVDYYPQPILMAENGTDSFLISVPYTGGEFADTQIRRLYPDMLLFLDGNYEASYGSFGFSDLFNQDDPVVVYSGISTVVKNIFSSLSSDFTEDMAYPDFDDLKRPSLVTTDFSGDGFANIFISGSNQEDAPITRYLINNGSGFNNHPVSVPNLQFSSICYGDFDSDSRYDLFVSGVDDASEISTGIYINDGTDFILTESLPEKLYKSTCAIGRFLDENTTSLLYFGTNNSATPDDSSNWRYVIFNDTRNWSKTLSGLLDTFDGSIYGDAVIADFSGDGLSDLFICGGTSGHETLTLFVNDLAVSGTFVPVYPFSESHALPECSLSAADYDFDGDLDLAYTGVGYGGEPILLFNNAASLNSPNSAPSPPAYINGSWNKTSGTLWINWSKGSDSKTPTGMISYNLEIESPTKGLLLSGQPAVTSKPAQGYLGNMQYRLNTTLYNRTPENVVVRIQSIDTGLKRSDWRETTIYFDACTPRGIWNISTPTGCTLPASIANNSIATVFNGSTLRAPSIANLGTNTTIRILNGTLDLSGSILSGTAARIEVGTNGKLIATKTVLDGINLTSNVPLTLVDSSLSGFESSAFAVFINTSWLSVDTTDEVDVRFYYEPEIRDQFGTSVLHASIFNGTAYLSGSRFNLTGYVINETDTVSKTHNLTFQKAGYYNRSVLLSLSGNAKQTVVLNKKPMPDAGTYSIPGLPENLGSDYSTDLSALGNVSGISVVREGIGKISYSEPVNLTFANLSQALSIQQNEISLNSSLAPGLNHSAILSFQTLSFQTMPVILRNGVVCDSCRGAIYTGNTFNVSVPGFSAYSLKNNSEIALLTPSVLFNNTPSNFSVIYHAFENTSELISDASCELKVGSDTMLLPEANGIHTATLKFNVTGETVVIVSCFGNSSFEPINQTFSLQVVRNGAYLLKDAEYTGLRFSSGLFGNLTGILRFWVTGHVGETDSTRTSLSYPSGFTLDEDYGSAHSELADLNNDGWVDLLIMGTTPSGPVFDWYKNLTEKHSTGVGLSDGDFEVFDYDQDGDFDILACGENSSGDARTVLLKNQLAENHFRGDIEFVEVQHTLPNVTKCSIEIATDTSGTWLAFSGKTSSQSNVASIYQLKGNEFLSVQQLEPDSWLLPELTMLLHDFTQDGISDLVLAGRKNNSPATLFFTGNGSGFVYDSFLSAQIADFDMSGTSLAVGRLTNESNETLLISGITDSGLQIKSYGFNGTAFVEEDVSLDVEPTYQGTLTLGDIDSDSDLDLFLTGQSVSGPISHLYASTLAQHAGPDEVPNPPAAISANYSNGTLHINWSNGSDTETPTPLLQYSLSIGSVTNPDSFLSRASLFSAGRTRTDMGTVNTANLTLPDACFEIQLRTMDSAHQLSSASTHLTENNHTEICNGYDNDCDGSIDEDFLYPGTDLFIYNGSINGTSFVCSFYEESYPELLSCPNDPAKSEGDPCNTATYSGAGYQWNSETKTCDCDLSGATPKNVQVNSVRTSGSSGIFMPTTDETPPQDEIPEKTSPPQATEQESQKSSSSSSEIKTYFTTHAPGFEIITRIGYLNDRTVVYNLIRNIDRTAKDDIEVTIGFDDEVSESLSGFRCVNAHEFVDGRTVKARVERLDYLEETTLLYSVPGHFSLEDFKAGEIEITASRQMDEEQLKAQELEQRIVAFESIVSNVSESTSGNKTTIRMEIDLKDNVSRVHGVEIEQMIPKCLINEITESILDSAINPELLDHVEIKESDPLLVWRFDRLEDAVNLDLTLDALRSADCNDSVTLRLLAKSFIYQNQPINLRSVMLVLLLSIGLFMLTLSPVYLAGKSRFHQHDNPHIVRLSKIILHKRHRGEPDEKIREHLLLNEEDETDIRDAFIHLNEHRPQRNLVIMYEHRVEIALFVSVAAMSLLEFFGYLPGYLDWFKKVLSWSIMLVVVHHANLSRLFFNTEAPRFSVTLTAGFFLMHLIRLAEFATNGLEKSIGFVFDWYVLIVRLDESIHLSWLLFFIGLLMVLGCAVYAAKKFPVREHSLSAIFFRPRQNPSKGAEFKRFSGWSILFLIFFFSVFNRMIEWLAIAVDSTIFVFTVIIMVAISLSMIAHHRGHHRHLDRIGEFLADGYLVWFGIVVAIYSFVHPLFSDQISKYMLWGMVLILFLTFLYVLIRLGKRHELAELEKIPLVLDSIYEKFIRLLRYPQTIALALSGLLIVQLVVESALYIIPNILGTASHLYAGSSGQTLFSFFGINGLVTQQLFLMPVADAVVHALMYVLSLMGLIVLLMFPIWVWTMAYRNRGHKTGSIQEWLNANTHWTGRIGRFLIISLLPLGIFYLRYCALYIVPMFTVGSAGVQFVPNLIAVSFREGLIALAVCAATLLLSASLLFRKKSKTTAIYVSSGLGISMLSAIYFWPFVESLWSETRSLFSGTEPILFRGTSWLLGSLQFADIMLIYLVGGLCAIYLILPPGYKANAIALLLKLPFFRRIQQLRGSGHLLEYFDEAKERFSGNMLHHLEHYVRRSNAGGIATKEQVRIMWEHGYSKTLIKKAVLRVYEEKKKKMTPPPDTIQKSVVSS